jgi:hypothetical protein
VGILCTQQNTDIYNNKELLTRFEFDQDMTGSLSESVSVYARVHVCMYLCANNVDQVYVIIDSNVRTYLRMYICMYVCVCINVLYRQNFRI